MQKKLGKAMENNNKKGFEGGQPDTKVPE
jgi:hypothetical protein